MNEKVHALINQQINKEFYSAYLYLHFSNYFVEVGLTALPTGIKFRLRKSVTTPCFSISTCKTKTKR